MFECYDTGGEKITRVGVASIKRVLNDLVDVTDESPEDYASVSCPDIGLYVTRMDKDYCITNLQGDDEDVPKVKAIKRFLHLRQDLMSKGALCSE